MRPEVGYAYLGGGTGITFTHRMHKILVYTKDYGLTPHLILHGEWERAIEEAVLRHVPTGGTVVEVGCNMGYHTLAMSEKLGPDGKLYGFEANPDVFRLLRWSLDLNGFLGRAKIYNHAVTEVEGEVQFQFNPIAVGGGNVVENNLGEGNQVIRVPGIPLDQTLADLPKVDLLRMDAEGFEPAILRGAQKLIVRSPEIVIICEWSVPMMASRVNLAAHIEWMYSLGFKAWRILSDASCEPVTQDQLLTIDHCEILFTRTAPK